MSRGFIAVLMVLVAGCGSTSGVDGQGDDALGDRTVQQWDGLIALEGVAQLPAHETIAVDNDPGKAFHVGTITDEEAWAQFASSAGITGLRAIDWEGQVVVFTILDAQTNALSATSWGIEGTTGRFTVEWSGIEPFYADSTPGALAVVERGSLSEVEFAVSGVEDKVLATVALGR